MFHSFKEFYLYYLNLPVFLPVCHLNVTKCHIESHRKKVQSIPIPHMTNLDNWVQNNNIFKVPTLFFK